ncbi:hypothetical protein M427DRAFT_51566 [Gonapodya prolifera JEL478]|uniref:Uncharacterized protein n=1 Tax=Gonapodya prolifera (strain JEL478) TaxID=1344416 RepID=A0A139AXA2_GONPJ|nr:hypothetical protein M427DRAFT_51566 [Gonapodya prolifera JEL478]|eukprot:KXS21337.1 hypothetical protein M427DRAFT_51566 [Gonapodya prolifera JEL478]
MATSNESSHELSLSTGDGEYMDNVRRLGIETSRLRGENARLQSENARLLSEHQTLSRLVETTTDSLSDAFARVAALEEDIGRLQTLLEWERTQNEEARLELIRAETLAVILKERLLVQNVSSKRKVPAVQSLDISQKAIAEPENSPNGVSMIANPASHLSTSNSTETLNGGATLAEQKGHQIETPVSEPSMMPNPTSPSIPPVVDAPSVSNMSHDLIPKAEAAESSLFDDIAVALANQGTPITEALDSLTIPAEANVSAEAEVMKSSFVAGLTAESRFRFLRGADTSETAEGVTRLRALSNPSSRGGDTKTLPLSQSFTSKATGAWDKLAPVNSLQSDSVSSADLASTSKGADPLTAFLPSRQRGASVHPAESAALKVPNELRPPVLSGSPSKGMVEDRPHLFGPSPILFASNGDSAEPASSTNPSSIGQQSKPSTLVPALSNMHSLGMYKASTAALLGMSYAYDSSNGGSYRPVVAGSARLRPTSQFLEHMADSIESLSEQPMLTVDKDGNVEYHPQKKVASK